MDEPELRKRLRLALSRVEGMIEAACERSGRRRSDIRLVAVTKSVDAEVARALHRIGVADLGESRPQELWHKAALLPRSVHWHLVGHLQTNKVERTLRFAGLIHSVDREKLLLAIEKAAERRGRAQDVLLQVNASREEQKHGFMPEDLGMALEICTGLKFVRVRGLMTMARYEPNPEDCRPTFALLRQLRDRYRDHLPEPHRLEHLSMGMSHDFPIAIEEGATIIRLGTILFESVRGEG